jgi:hypothetical protein
MRRLKRMSASLLAFCLCGTGAEAGTGFCTTPDDMAALRTAALQQELMVAGLTCQATDAYNRFVLAYRPELQKSDADLKAYFLRRDGARGEASYDSFKTKLANLSSLSDIANAGGYCASTRAAFATALQSHQGLASFVASQRLLIALPEQSLCVADPSWPVMAAAPAASLTMASATPVAVIGVPQHDLPASPYGAMVAPQPPARAAAPNAPGSYPPPRYQDPDSDGDYDSDEDGQAAPIPPAPPQFINRPAVIEAARAPAYGAAGWPPGWGPVPYPQWYGPQPYPYYNPYYGYGR